MTTNPLADTTLAIATRSSEALTLANQLTITNDQSALEAGIFLKLIKALQSEVKTDREEELRNANATKDAILAGRNKHLLPLQQAETIIKTKQIVYDDEKIAKRKAEQAEYDRQAQEETDALEAQAMLEAAALDEIGATDQAEAIRQVPIEPIAPVISPQVKVDVAGQHTTVRWKVRMVDKEKVERDLLTFDQVVANQAVQTIKNEFSRETKDERWIKLSLKVAAIADLPNGTVLTKEIIGVEIPGCEIFIDKGRASTSA